MLSVFAQSVKITQFFLLQLRETRSIMRVSTYNTKVFCEEIIVVAKRYTDLEPIIDLVFQLVNKTSPNVRGVIFCVRNVIF